MTPVQIQLESGLSIVVIFVDDLTVMLSAIRSQIFEEIEELVPKDLHFLSTWEPPISRAQETKMALTEVLHKGNILMLREMSVQCPAKREATKEVEEADEACKSRKME